MEWKENAENNACLVDAHRWGDIVCAGAATNSTIKSNTI